MSNEMKCPRKGEVCFEHECGGNMNGICASGVPKHDREEIIKSLQIIKDVCTSTDCRECPIGTDDGRCMLDEKLPVEWNLNDEGNVVWRAFKQ